MDGGGGQQRRHGDAVRPLRAVREDQDVVIGQHRLGCRPAHFADRHFKTIGPTGGIPGDVDRGGAEGAIKRRLDRADLGDILVGQDRLVDLEPLVAAGIAAQQVGARADHADQRHNQFFADRVDRRIGDLREVLLEIVVEQPRTVRQHRNRSVGAHRAERIVGIDRHRLKEARKIFLRIAEGLLAIEQAAPRPQGFHPQLRQLGLDHFEVLELVLRLPQPFLVRFGLGEAGLDFLVLDDPAFLKVDQQHPARLEPPLADDIVFLEGQHARFAGHHHQIAISDAEARRAQAIAIQRRADLAPIGKGNRRRPVPRLHQRGMIFVESAALGIHQRIASPGLGDQHHHRMGQTVAARQQQLERIVEAGRIRLAMRDQRPHLVEIRAEQLALHRAAAGIHPVDVAAHGVDLAVVGDETVGVRQLPAGEGVGGKALVDQPQRRNAGRIGQVAIETANLRRQQQPLVDHRAAGEAGHIQLGQPRQAMLLRQRRQRVLGLLADREDLAFEGVLIGAIGPARDDALADYRH